MFFSSFQLLDTSKPIVVFGRDGQVGKALQKCFKDSTVPVVFLGRSDCDLANEVSINQVLNKYQPQVIINAAAYTAVDKAESEFESAFAINAHAPKVMAQFVANQAHGVFIHYSTDYVFADTKETAYFESDITGPIDQLCLYGQSKLAGEKAIQVAFNYANNSEDVSHQDESPKYFILRTSWVYGDGSNFIRTILRLAAERAELKVVVDQVGVPTSAKWLAELTLQFIEHQVTSGIYHVVPNGETSWYGLAQFAIAEAISVGSLKVFDNFKILPIPAVEYQVPAKRPHNSRLSNDKLRGVFAQIGIIGACPTWQNQLVEYIKHESPSSGLFA